MESQLSTRDIFGDTVVKVPGTDVEWKRRRAVGVLLKDGIELLP